MKLFSLPLALLFLSPLLCAQTWIVNPGNGRSYALTGSMTWTQAQAQAVNWGGSLVTVRNVSEQDWLVQTFGVTSTVNLWTGFNDVAKEGDWVWISGERVTFVQWGPSQPDGGSKENHGTLWGAFGGSWNDRDGTTAKLQGIVERSSKQGSFTRVGLGCRGSATGIPELGSVAAPRLGDSLTLTLSNAPSLAPAVLLFGMSYNFDLGAVGAKGCTLYVNPMILSAQVTDIHGSWVVRPSLPIPNQPQLIGLSFSMQSLHFDAAANQLGLIASNGRQGTIGESAQGLVEEEFSVLAHLDDERSGAIWGAGKLLPGKLGGSGMHGAFRADIVPQSGVVNGRKLYVWDTNLIQIPFTATLRGEKYWKAKLGQSKTQLDVRNGVLEFTSFRLAKDEHLRFIGGNVPSIRVTGRARIDGVIEAYVPAPNRAKPGPWPAKGGAGNPGGPGGASGGQGGDTPSSPTTVGGGFIQGRAGGNVVFPAGHPRAASAAGTGGPGSPANPPDGKNSSVLLAPKAGFDMARMTAAGGSGGSLWSPDGKAHLGSQGLAVFTSAKAPFGQYQPQDKGAPGNASKEFAVLPVVSGIASSKLFLLGASGGGGGGSHVFGSIRPKLSSDWYAGFGGGGGGGVLHFQTGGEFVLSSSARISARGGDAAVSPDSGIDQPSAGGGGSGGSILVQAAGRATIAGEVNVLGGKGGKCEELTIIAMRSLGGDGGAGYVRIETAPATAYTQFPAFKPAATAQNVGLLRADDYDPMSVAASTWYNTGSKLRPTYLYYKIQGKINGNAVSFADEKATDTRADATQPITLLVQSTELNIYTGQPLPSAKRSEWIEASLLDLNKDPAGHNGFRFMLFFDKSKLYNNKKVNTIEIEKIQFYLGL